ncbi:MAG: D-2-hydroxyacid dehydrogenase [Epsilonproteobacteria bacterium]|nr:D-2-hydroxyacid dehydrogenase [Campylobacterota bacterium]
MKIVILDKKTLGDDIDLGCFDRFGEVVMYGNTTKEETLERINDADIVVTNKVVIDRKIMDKSNIKLICVAATGMNNIDLEYAKQKGIVVKNVAGYSTPSVVQTTFSLALYLIGKLRYLDDFTKGDGWVESSIFTNIENPYVDISGKTWGIIGLGEIGKGVAKVAEAFGAQVQYYSTSGRNRDSEYQRASLEDLLKSSDIISIHAPLNDQTHNLLNEDNLTLLKKHTVLLNLGRGGIINEKELAIFIDKSEIFVGLDVLEKEPMTQDSPFRNVVRKEALFITPHIAWASVESRVKLVKGICENIETYLGGK